VADFLADVETVQFTAEELAGRLFDLPGGEIGHCIGPKSVERDGANVCSTQRVSVNKRVRDQLLAQ
jgi:hypothetical protein